MWNASWQGESACHLNFATVGRIWALTFIEIIKTASSVVSRDTLFAYQFIRLCFE